jgi:hypothetical protein
MDFTPLIPYAGLFIGIGMMAIVITIAILSSQIRKRAWEELAQRTGLQVMGGGLFSPMQLQGSYRGHPLTLYTFTRSTGKSSQTYTVIAVQVANKAGLKLEIKNRNLFSPLRKLFGRQDFEIGDMELDRRFIFNGEPEMDVRQVLASGSLRQKLLDTPRVNLKLEGNTLKQTLSRAVRDIDLLQAQFELLTEMASSTERGQRNG